MGRPRTSQLDLPERLYFKNGGYHYVYTSGGKQLWELLSRDRGKAIELAEGLNALRLPTRLAALGSLRIAGEKMRDQILQRDGWRCVYCGASEGLGIDHVIPWSRGGATAPFNLVAACLNCNVGKGDNDPQVFIAGMFELRERLLPEIIRHAVILLDQGEIDASAST